MYPYNTVGWDDTLSSIHTCRNQSKELCPKLKWLSNLWMNVLVMVRGKCFLSSLILGFFARLLCVFCSIRCIEHAHWLSTRFWHMSSGCWPALCPNHCFSLLFLFSSKFAVLSFIAFSKSQQVCLPLKPLLHPYFSLFCWLTYFACGSGLLLTLQWEAKWSFYLLEDFLKPIFFF